MKLNTKPVLTVKKDGCVIEFDKGCPHQQHMCLCGNWCPLFVISEPNTTMDCIQVSLKCTHDFNLTYLFSEIREVKS